uniref:Uncharacterized protein n=1 Tax=Populus alba TaxID=43335 RepID=A0A4U5Q4U1_POPAL|nr:hypothetical protein D5086_0000155740 [Populus alba]
MLTWRRTKPAGSDGSGGAREEVVVPVVVAAASLELKTGNCCGSGAADKGGAVGCCGWFCVAEAGDPLMSPAVSVWWLPLVCVGGSNSAWIGGFAGLLGGGFVAVTGGGAADGRSAVDGRGASVTG